MTHVRTSPSYPQSNGTIERWYKSLKGECIRRGTPLSLEEARRLGLRRALQQCPPETVRSATSRRRRCSPGVRRRSTPTGIGSWRRGGNNGRFVASRPREKAKSLVSGRFRVTDDVDSGWPTARKYY